VPDPNGLVPISEAARVLNVPARTLRGAVRRGSLPSVRRTGSAPGGRIHWVKIEDVQALYQPTTSPNGGPAQGAPAIEAAVEAVVAAAVAREAAPLRGELEAALATVREVAAHLASVDAERRELERQRAALEAEQARLADAIEKHRTARAAYETKRREMSRAMVEMTRTPAVGTGAARGR